MKENNLNSKFKITYIVSIILCMFLLILPWVCYKVQINASSEEKTVIPTSIKGVTDYFLAGKGLLTIITALIILALFFFMCFQNKRGTNIFNRVKEMGYAKIFAFTGMYIVLVIVSAIFSKYKRTAIFGNMNSCEGAIVLCSYMILFIAASLSFKAEKSIRLFKKTVMILAFITVVLTLIDFFYRPISQIIFPEGFSTDFINMVSLTFYNPGYFGGFCILIFPIIGGYFLKEEKGVKIILYGIISVLMVFATITSRSTTAFYLLIFEIVIILLIFFTQKICKRRLKLFVGLFCIVFVVSLNMISNNKLFHIINSSATNATTAIKSDSTYILKGIIVDGNKITLQGENSQLVAQMSNSSDTGNSSIKFFDSNNNLLNPNISDNKIYFQDKYEAISVYIENNALTINLGYKAPIRFYMYNNIFYPMLSDKTIIKNIDGNNLGLERFYSVATGRGYFWVNSIPILKNTMLTGHGPGTFELYFKQYDFVGLLNSQGTTELVVDKPHSFYLQVATQTGIVSMLFIVGIFVTIIFNAIKIYIRHRSERKYSLKMDTLMGLSLGNFSYMIFLLANDSSLTVSPVFWLLLGINACIAVNKESGLFLGITKKKDSLRECQLRTTEGSDCKSSNY